MNATRRRLARCILFATTAAIVAVGPSSRIVPRVAADNSASTTHAAAPLRPSFHANAGQFPPVVRYAATLSDHRLYLTDEGAVAMVRRADRAHRLGWRFVGGRKQQPIAEERLAGIANYLVGDRSRWRAGVPTVGRVRYPDAYEDIDIIYYSQPGAIEFDLEVAPGGDPTDIRIAFEGVTSIDIDRRDGSLVLAWADGELRWQAPVVYQEKDGARQSISARYVLRADGAVAFDVGNYDKSRMLVIDPLLLSSTFVGGSASEAGGKIVVNAEGETFLVGSTSSLDFPATPGAYDTTLASSSDVFVARLSADQSSLEFATFLGGAGIDSASGVALDAYGNVYVTGLTTSADFPSVNAYQPAYLATQCPFFATFTEPCRDAFVTKLSPNGDSVIYSTFFGGSQHDAGAAVDVNDAGEAFILGSTTSPDLPLLNPIDSAYVPSGCGPEGLPRPCADAFVMRLSASGSALGYSTYLGGDLDEAAGDIVVDEMNRATVVGSTQSDNFPVAAAMQPMRAPGSCGVAPVAFTCFDLFVSRIAPLGGSFEFSTYFGGDGDDRGFDLVIGADQTIWLTGHTTSIDLPLANPLQSALAGPAPADSQCLPMGGSTNLRCPDALVARLDSTGSTLLNSTYLGGVRRDEARTITLDATGRVAIAGLTQSFDFPVVDAWQWNYVYAAGCPVFTLPCSDAFVTLLRADAGAVVYSTYLGSFDNDIADALAAAPDGSLVVAGNTGPNFPTTPSSLREVGNGTEAFVARLAAPPANGVLVTLAGTGRPGTPSTTAAQALRTSFGALMDVAVYNFAIRYVADSSNHRVLRIDASNMVTVVAGNGTQGSGGDGGLAVNAQLNTPGGVAVDVEGNVYVADSGNNRVRMVNTNGEILTIAGTGTPGFSGDGGPGHLAELNYPVGVVVFGDNLIVADAGNSRVRMITLASNVITTLAGTGCPPCANGDGGPSIFASLILPTGVAIDPNGRLLIADFGAHNVRRVTQSGIISTVAGQHLGPGSGGDGGPATAAQLNGPFGIDVAASGQIVISELLGHRARSISPDGTIGTLAGTMTLGGTPLPGPIQVPPRAAVESPLWYPAGVAVDGLGNVLLTDIGNYRVALARLVAP